MYAITWAVSLGLAGIAGLLYGNVNNVTPQASTIGLAAMPAAVIGGLTSLPGAIVGGLIVGVFEGSSATTSGRRGVSRRRTLLLFAMLLVRPNGLFGRRELDRV